MAFSILKESGAVNGTKTRKVEKHLYRACDRISKVIFDEVTKFQEYVEGENVSGHFWGSVSHRAFLYLSESQQDVYVSAEIADIFAAKDLKDPRNVISIIDIDRLDAAREKENEKQTKKRARQPK